MLDTLDAEARANVTEEEARLLSSLASGSFRQSALQQPSGAPWRTRELELALGDTLLLLCGADEAILERQVVEEAIVHALAYPGAPYIARAIGEYLGAPSGWSAPPEAERLARVRWTVASRVSIAVVRCLDDETPP